MATKQKWSILLADTVMKRYPNPDDFPYRTWTYSQGFMLWGMIRLWEQTGNTKYYHYVFKYVDGHVDENGVIAAFKGESMDDVMTGSVIVWAYAQTGLKKYKLACDSIRRVFDTYPRTSTGAFWHGECWANHEFWVDGVFMGQMFLAKYGKFVGDSEYCFDEAAKQLALIEHHCRKDNTGLILHGWSEDKTQKWADKVTGLSSEVWSEGLGWYALILVETLEIFPLEHPKREQIIKQLMNLLEDLKKHQDNESGLWYQVVDKGHLSDNWCDTSGSAMFVYAIKKAIELGIANESTYFPVAQKGYEGIITKAKINEDGFVDIFDACDGVCIQNNYQAYIDFDKIANAKEAVAAFLWATIIMEKAW
jgi:rhamnogalacturonyl hydrolase YesR